MSGSHVAELGVANERARRLGLHGCRSTAGQSEFRCRPRVGATHSSRSSSARSRSRPAGTRSRRCACASLTSCRGNGGRGADSEPPHTELIARPSARRATASASGAPSARSAARCADRGESEVFISRPDLSSVSARVRGGAFLNTANLQSREPTRNPSDTSRALARRRFAICGSDLHMYEGRTGADAGIVLGHESTGIVEEVGSGGTRPSVGDRVVIPLNVPCGFCRDCEAGKTGFCLTVNEGFAGGAYGCVEMGPYRSRGSGLRIRSDRS